MHTGVFLLLSDVLKGLFCSLFSQQRSLNHDGAFQALFLQIACNGVRLEDVSFIMLIVGVASPTTIELSPTVPTAFFGIDICRSKTVFHLAVIRPLQNIAHDPLIISNELMAGKNFT